MTDKNEHRSPPQIAAENVAAKGGSREAQLVAYETKRKELGLKIDLPD